MTKRIDKWKSQGPQPAEALKTVQDSPFGVATAAGEASMSKSRILWEHELSLASQMSETVAALRNIRDSKVYLADNSGAHTFREWCVNKFGEGIGIWMDDHL